MVRNKFVKIQHGKEIVRKNNILDAYPEHIAKRQMGTLDTTSTGINETDNQFELSTLLLKLDTPLEGLKEMGVNKLNITGEDLEGDLSVINNGDNSLTINGSLPVDEGTTQEGTSFTLTDAEPDKKASITKLEGNTTQNGTPTPTNPIPIYTVSGDNNVVVSNKNLFDYQYSQLRNINRVTISEETNGFKLTSTGVAGYGFASLPIDNNLIGKQVTISCTSTGNKTPSARLFYHNASGTLVTNIGAFWTTNTAHTVTLPSTLPSNANGIDIVFYISQGNNASGDNAIFTDIQIEKGNQATSYIAHQGNSYRVDFGGKNKLDLSAFTTTTSNGITVTPITNNGVLEYLESSGTYSQQTYITLTNTLHLEPNTKYFLSGAYSASARLRLREYASGGSNLSEYFDSGSGISFTTKSNVSYVNVQIVFYAQNNVKFYPQIELGTVATEYSPYVSNPIELCKIGNYVDKLKRAEGKNLFDKDNMNKLNGYFESNNVITASNYNRIFYIECEPNTTYTIAQNPSTSPISNHLLQVATSSVLPAIGVECTSNHNIGGDTSYTMTTNADAKYLVFRIRSGDDIDSYLSTIMINYGSTALPYEPYGVGVWYIEKNISKVVLNGTQNITLAGSGVRRFNATYSTLGITNIKDGTSAQDSTLNYRKCDHFAYSSGQTTWGGYYMTGNWLVLYDSGSTIADANALKTWFTSNPTSIYYVLSTPTYETITNENLLQQLENMQDIELIDNLCYVDWVGEEKPTMTLKYNYKTEYEYDLGVQDFTLSANNTYNVNANGLSLKLANDSTIYEGAGTYTPTQETEVTSAKLLIPLGVNFSSTVYPTVEKQSGLRNTEFDVHYVDSLDISVTNYKCFTTLTKNGCIARYQYTYDRHSRFRSYRDGQVYDMADLNGRRITAIGFACNWIGGGSYQSTREVLAVLDTSNYALYINQEIPMNITRVDEITSDAEFYTNNTEITGPLHLDPLRTNCDKERGGI